MPNLKNTYGIMELSVTHVFPIGRQLLTLDEELLSFLVL